MRFRRRGPESAASSLPHYGSFGPVALLLFACLTHVAAQPDESTAALQLELETLEARIGDRISVTLIIDLAQGAVFEPLRLGPQLGPFHVEGGRWDGPLDSNGRARWVWSAQLVAFRTGEQELPPIELPIRSPAGELTTVASEPLTLHIVSVLTDDDLSQAEPELSDLKRPVSMPANLRPLWTALIVVAALLLGAAVLWWLHRRYGSRLAAVPAPDDPFRRTPPHVWVYAELQKLLDRRLPEQNLVEQFYGELSWILKRYLGGRYRVELMERTSAEVPVELRRAVVPADAIDAVQQFLGECDGVKFARETRGAAAWRAAVEQVYRIVDTTKPADAAQGAA